MVAQNLSASDSKVEASWFDANGKVILFGEHAVVYGVEALAAGLPAMVRARALSRNELGSSSNLSIKSKVSIPAWGLEIDAFELGSSNVLQQMCERIRQALKKEIKPFYLEIDAKVPPASGLGASASVAVAMTKALAAHAGITLNADQVNQIAYGCEQLAHGTPSGLDNTLATYGGVQRFQRVDGGVRFSVVDVPDPIELLIVLSGKKGYTAETVARVRAAREAALSKYDQLFSQIAEISSDGLNALRSCDLDKLGRLLTANQQCLREVGVSCVEIEQVIELAVSTGVRGAKLTGSGDGGAVIILPKQNISDLEQAFQQAGYKTLRAHIGAC